MLQSSRIDFEIGTVVAHCGNDGTSAFISRINRFLNDSTVARCSKAHIDDPHSVFCCHKNRRRNVSCRCTAGSAEYIVGIDGHIRRDSGAAASVAKFSGDDSRNMRAMSAGGTCIDIANLPQCYLSGKFFMICLHTAVDDTDSDFRISGGNTPRFPASECFVVPLPGIIIDTVAVDLFKKRIGHIKAFHPVAPGGFGRKCQ